MLSREGFPLVLGHQVRCITGTQGFVLNSHDRRRDFQTRRRLLRALVQSIKSFESNVLAFGMKILRYQKLQEGEKGRVRGERERDRQRISERIPIGFIGSFKADCAGNELSGILASCQMQYQFLSVTCYMLKVSRHNPLPRSS